MHTIHMDRKTTQIDLIMVLCRTRHKIGHFRDVYPGMEKITLTQQKHAFNNQKKCTTTQNKHKKIKSQVAFYDIRTGNGVGHMKR